MSKSAKIFLGIASFLPIASVILYLVFFVSSFIQFIPEFENHADEPPPGFIRYILLIAIFAIVMILVNLALMIYFIIHALNNPQVSSDERVIWILLFILVSIVAFPIYWIIRILNTPDKNAVLATG